MCLSSLCFVSLCVCSINFHDTHSNILHFDWFAKRNEQTMREKKRRGFFVLFNSFCRFFELWFRHNCSSKGRKKKCNEKNRNLRMQNNRQTTWNMQTPSEFCSCLFPIWCSLFCRARLWHWNVDYFTMNAACGWRAFMQMWFGLPSFEYLSFCHRHNGRASLETEFRMSFGFSHVRSHHLELKYSQFGIMCVWCEKDDGVDDCYHISRWQHTWNWNIRWQWSWWDADATAVGCDAVNFHSNKLCVCVICGNFNFLFKNGSMFGFVIWNFAFLSRSFPSISNGNFSMKEN